MNNSETEPEKRGPGKPQIEGLTTRSFAVDADDYAWFMARYKGELLPDGTKNNINRVIRRLMRSHREEVEKNDLYAASKKGSS
jgi:hypothetical protein